MKYIALIYKELLKIRKRGSNVLDFANIYQIRFEFKPHLKTP